MTLTEESNASFQTMKHLGGVMAIMVMVVVMVTAMVKIMVMVVVEGMEVLIPMVSMMGMVEGVMVIRIAIIV